MSSLLYFIGLAASIQPRLPAGLRLGVIGGSRLFNARSRPFCLAIGEILAEIPGLVLITGGVAGVGDTVCDGYASGCRANQRDAATCHILPEGHENGGKHPTLYAGRTMKERREVLGRLAGVYLAVEGGSGTAHEIRIARSQGATVVPVAALGGAAERAYRLLKCPQGVNPLDWDRIGNSVLPLDTLVNSTSRVLDTLLSSPAHG